MLIHFLIVSHYLQLVIFFARRNFMLPKSIDLIPDYGFDPTQNYSHKQMLWLKYRSYKNNITIQHCLSQLTFWRKKLVLILWMVIVTKLTQFMNFRAVLCMAARNVLILSSIKQWVICINHVNRELDLSKILSKTL